MARELPTLDRATYAKRMLSPGHKYAKANTLPVRKHFVLQVHASESQRLA